jgi:hypothetical protein
LAGWKQWASGEVVEHTDFQNYLQDQVVQVYAGTAARSSALGTAVTEGMMSYLSDSNQVQVYDGAAWAEVSGSTSPNVIINGAFDFWQRGTSFGTATSGNYYPDRGIFVNNGSGFVVNITRESFTTGTTLGNNESEFFYRYNQTTAGTSATITTAYAQRIENIRTLANKTITISAYIKTDTPRSLNFLVGFAAGTGGSGAPASITGPSFTTSTSWQRYSFTTTIPSLTGATLGAGNNMSLQIRAANNITQTIDVWGVQLEEGSTSTPLRRNAISLQGELAACQRYYYRQTSGAAGQHFANGNNQSTTVGAFLNTFPVAMRIAPTALEQTGTAGDYSIRHQATNTTNSAVPAHDSASTWAASYTFTVASGLTAGNGSFARPVNSTAYLAWSAEL